MIEPLEPAVRGSVISDERHLQVDMSRTRVLELTALCRIADALTTIAQQAGEQ